MEEAPDSRAPGPGTELTEVSGNTRRMSGPKATATVTRGSGLITGAAVVGLPTVDFTFTTELGPRKNAARAATRKSSRISSIASGATSLTSSQERAKMVLSLPKLKRQRRVTDIDGDDDNVAYGERYSRPLILAKRVVHGVQALGTDPTPKRNTRSTAATPKWN
jgi:hypothetical protein